MIKEDNVWVGVHFTDEAKKTVTLNIQVEQDHAPRIYAAIAQFNTAIGTAISLNDVAEQGSEWLGSVIKTLKSASEPLIADRQCVSEARRLIDSLRADTNTRLPSLADCLEQMADALRLDQTAATPAGEQA